MLPRILIAAVSGLILALPCAAQDAMAKRAVQVLQAQCSGCHGGNVAMSDLRIDSREALLKGGQRGSAVKSGSSQSSLLIQAVNHSGKLAMPPGKKIEAADAELLTRWVDAGAPWPQVSKWWSFQPPVRPAVPAISDPWVRTTIDAFILEKLRAAKLQPAAAADPRALIRRVYYDMHGLPPTPDVIEKFVNDKSSDAYEKLVDGLLASPRYGEKWGRHWLDLVRYGDTAGFEQDPYLLYAWRYRDYVIESFNQDKPYDRFVKEQIAGDELYPDDPVAQTGTGYYTVSPNRDMLFKVEDVNRVETLTDYVDTTGAVFLGLTVACARCHDHKFDPISQRDYYRMQAIFVPAEKTRIFLQYDPARGYDLAENIRHAKLREIGDQLEAILKPYQKRLSDEKLAKLPADVRDAFATEEGRRTPAQRAVVEENRKKISPGAEEVRAILTPEHAAALHKIEVQLVGMFTGFKAGPFAPGVRDISREAPKTFLPAKAGAKPEAVNAGLLSALGGGDISEPPVDATSTLRRKALAEWIASPSNPLTARVIVNRIWQYHFGKGLVSTPSDFGVRGATPTHPELLDWLATEFVANGWSMKKLQRQILLSSVYRQSTTPSSDAQQRDAENKLLSHMNRRRLFPEEMRDGMLQASGALNLKMGGRPVVPPVDKEELYGLSQSPDSMWIVTANPDEQRRRSVYMFSRRTFRPAMFENFDAPDGIRTCARRESSNTAPQSLTLLNGRWTTDESRRLGALICQGNPDSAEIVKQAWRAVLGRQPDASELERGQKFLQLQTSELGSMTAAASELARALFNSNEFLYVD
jgi:hypothetical protein